MDETESTQYPFPQIWIGTDLGNYRIRESVWRRKSKKWLRLNSRSIYARKNVNLAGIFCALDLLPHQDFWT